MISPWHIATFALVLLLVFDPKRLLEMGRSLGKGLRELKDGITEHEHSASATDCAAAQPAGRAARLARARLALGAT